MEGMVEINHDTASVIEDNIPCKIEEGLYLGSVAAAENKAALVSLNVTHILTIAFAVPARYPNDFVYKILDTVIDEKETDISQHFDECFEFINEGKKKGGVLVHCFMGISRSATVVIAYLMKQHGMSLSKALNHVQSKRPVASPNAGFMAQLRNLEKTLKGSQPNGGVTSYNEV